MARMALRVLLALIAIQGLSAPPAVAAIRGTVTVPSLGNGSGATLNPYPGRASSIASPARLNRGAVTDAVIYLDGPAPAAGPDDDSMQPAVGTAGTEGAAAAKTRHRLAQKGQAFVPRVLAVLAGTRIDFPNEDPIYHNVFSVSPAKRFDLGKYARGKSKSVVFEKPGRINVYCDIHSNMEAFVLVLANRWFAQPDAEGRFTLPDLPPGSYRVKAWHPDFGERTLSLEVRDGSDATLPVAF